MSIKFHNLENWEPEERSMAPRHEKMTKFKRSIKRVCNDIIKKNNALNRFKIENNGNKKN